MFKYDISKDWGIINKVFVLEKKVVALGVTILVHILSEGHVPCIEYIYASKRTCSI